MVRVINVGADAAKSGKFANIPEGTILTATVYAIDEVPVKSGANAGERQLDVTFKIQSDFTWTDEKLGEQSAKGREIRFQKLPLYESAGAWKLVTFAQSVGWKTTGGNVELPDNLQSVVGTPLNIKVTIGKPNQSGVSYNQVGGYASASDAGVKATPSADASPSWAALNSPS